MKSYRHDETIPVSQNAIAHIIQYLSALSHTEHIQDVSEDRKYKHHEIDIIWDGLHNGRRKRVTILIKADRYHNTGNFWLELMDKVESRRLGCFMKSRADFMFYYFTVPQTLYIVDLPKCREWYKENQHDFKQKKTSTRMGNDMYESLGALVPIDVMCKALEVKVIDLSGMVEG